MSQIKLTISVHQLVDFLLRIGDIDNRIYNKATMLMGTKIHSYYQKKQNNEYISEYELQETFFLDNFEINLQGRADGIIIDRKNNKVIIDEIKSTVSSLEEFYNQQVKWHLGQAECYALMYAHEKKLDEIDIRLTYISQLDQKEMIKQYTFKKEKLEQEIEMMLREYLEFYQIVYRHTLERNKSLANLKFPFTTFRSGQRNLSKYVYGAMKNGGNLFVEAPTGIGKTMSTIYPSVLSFGSSLDKVFYVTAKTSGRESATKAIELLKEHGLRAKNIIITAKDKICFNPGSGCNPDECPYAKGYYGKIKDAITEMLINEDSFNYDSIVKHAMENDICPFEFQLDLSLYSDIIVCDYNYVFDPQVYLRRFFDDVKDRYGLLVDEAHNLIDRGREMFSASINLKKMENLKKSLKKLDSKSLKNCLNKIIKYIKQYYELKNENPYYIFTSGFDITIINLLEKYVTLSQNVIKNNHEMVENNFIDFHFEVNKFLKIYDIIDDEYIQYIAFENENDLSLKIYCLDPSKQLGKTLRMFKGTTIFSATLSPIEYYVDLLGGYNDDPKLVLDSPFPKDNLLIMVQPNISTLYSKRENSYNDIALSIQAAIANKIGNYFVFFPSYLYLEKVLNAFSQINILDVNILYQSKSMSDEDKNKFLDRFKKNPSKTTIGFVVLGGVFSEGIDLIEDRLIGAIIVGVGLPQICFEREVIKDYYAKKNLNGFNYAYVNTGINKVMQAAGRVIRSETDRGIVLFIDDRYLHSNYQKIFKGSFRNYQVVYNNIEINNKTTQFWKK